MTLAFDTATDHATSALVDDGEVLGERTSRAVTLLEERGAVVPPESDERHLPRARFHAQLAHGLGPVDEIEPLYLRVPDAVKSAAR